MRFQGRLLAAGLCLLLIFVSTGFVALWRQSKRPVPPKHQVRPPTPSAPNLPRVHGGAFSMATKRINPHLEIGLIHSEGNPIKQRLWLCLEDKQLNYMYSDDLYTLRLWLFDRHWRLLNRAPIPVAGAFDARGRFRPQNAIASLKPGKIEVLFEVRQDEWQNTDRLLVTGGGAYGTTQAFDFELLIPKPSVSALPKPRLTDAHRSFRWSGRKPRSRWRYWVQHSSPFQQYEKGWQLGAWVYDYLPASKSASQVERTGWSQCLVWIETANLRDTEHSISFLPEGFFEYFYTVFDRDVSFSAAYYVNIEVFSSQGYIQVAEKAGGYGRGLIDPVILHLPAGYSLGTPEQKNYTIRINPLHDAPSEPKSIESLLFPNRPFTEAHEGGNEIVSPSERREPSLASTFCLMRVQTCLHIRAAKAPKARSHPVSYVGGMFTEPFCRIFVETNDDREHGYGSLLF